MSPTTSSVVFFVTPAPTSHPTDAARSAASRLGAPVTFDYFGSLAEHECHLARLAKVTDAGSFTDACMGLRECGYDDPSVVEKVKEAARVVGDTNLLDAVESVEEQEELLDTILHGYGFGGQFRMVLPMDGSACVRIPQRMLGAAT